MTPPISPAAGSRRLQNFLTIAVALIATVAQSTGMWNFFGDKFHITNPLLRATLFAFIELAILVCALRARRHRIDHGGINADGLAVWVLALVSGFLSSTDTDTWGARFGRLVVPLVAAWMFERAISVERIDRTGVLTGINWRVSPERVLVWLRLADPTSRDVADVARSHQLTRLAQQRFDLHRVPEKRAGRRRRAERRFLAMLRRADAELGLAVDGSARVEFEAHLALRYEALEQTTPAAVADRSPWRSLGRNFRRNVVSTQAELPPGTSGTSAGTSTGTTGKRATGSSGGTSARNNGPKVPERSARRTAADTRKLAAELLAQDPELTQGALAARLGITDRRLREVLSKPDGGADPKERHTGANGNAPDLAEVTA